MDGFYIGDIIGNSYTHENEKYNKKTKDFEFFTERSKFSDDTILTFATIDWLLHTDKSSKAMIDCLKKSYKSFPDKNPTIYGPSYVHWITNSTGYKFSKSKGNGGAMRSSPIAWYAKSLKEINQLITKGILPTHNTYFGKIGAKIVCYTIWYLKNNYEMQKVKEIIGKTFSLNLDIPIAKYRKNYSYTFESIETVRPALVSFFNSTSFEDAIRNAVSFGGDTDTITTITAAIAEAYYKNIDKNLIKKCQSFLPKKFLKLLKEFNKYLDKKQDC